jgi:hypothetical protein
MSQTAAAALLPEDQGERKFLLDEPTARTVWQHASERLQLQLRDAARPVTYHRTTYFDTPDHVYYRGSGPVATRIRVREYATACAPGAAPTLMRPCFLELKQSAAGLRSKTRLEVTEAREVEKHLVQWGGSRLVPCLTTWYQRSALTDATERIRITLDSDLRYCPPQPLGAPCAADPEAVERVKQLILEVKVWGTHPHWLQRLLRTVCEAAEFSKFRSGMQAVLGSSARIPSAMHG